MPWHILAPAAVACDIFLVRRSASSLRSGRRRTIVHRTMCALAERFYILGKNTFLIYKKTSSQKGRGLNHSRYHPDSCKLFYRHSCLCNVQLTASPTLIFKNAAHVGNSITIWTQENLQPVIFSLWQEMVLYCTRSKPFLIIYKYFKWIYLIILTQHFCLSSLCSTPFRIVCDDGRDAFSPKHAST